MKDALLEEDDEEDAFEEEETEVPSPGFFRAQRAASRQEFNENAAVRPRQNRKVGKLLLLFLIEIAAIAEIVRWWIQWW